MKLARWLTAGVLGATLFLSTGCFRVSSDTRALRNAALDNAEVEAEETIEFGAGFFTVGLVRLGARFVELPPEARLILGSVNGAECSVYEMAGRTVDLGKVLAAADRAMNKRGCERVVGVRKDRQLVAVYIPREASSPRRMKITLLVLNERQLVCASARGDLESILQFAMSKAELPERKVAAAF